MCWYVRASVKAGLHVRCKHKHKPRVNRDDASTSARSFFLHLCLRRPGSHVAFACDCVVRVLKPAFTQCLWKRSHCFCSIVRDVCVCERVFLARSTRACPLVHICPSQLNRVRLEVFVCWRRCECTCHSDRQADVGQMLAASNQLTFNLARLRFTTCRQPTHESIESCCHVVSANSVTSKISQPASQPMQTSDI